MMDKKVIADRLRELRNKKNITTTQMSIKTGVSRTAITNYENGHRVPDREKMKILADFFDTTVDAIFFTL